MVHRMRKKLKILSTIYYQLSTPKGFTLIELLVVFSITGILSAIGVVGFVSFNQSQTISSSANEVVTILNLAKSRALSQVKLGSCTSSQSLEGYEVQITVPRIYKLNVRCSGFTYLIETKTLPQDISFTASSSYFFPILIGGVANSGEIEISGYLRTKTITISSSGGVTIQ